MHQALAVRRYRWLIAILILTHLPGLAYVFWGAPLAQEMDTPVLLQRIDAAGGLAGAWRWFVGDWPLESHLYRPLTVFSLTIDRHLWGEWEPGYRLTAWVLGLLTSALLIWLSLALTGNHLVAALACALLAAERFGYMPGTSRLWVRHASLIAIAVFLVWLLGRVAQRQQARHTADWCRAALMVVLAAGVALGWERQPLETLSWWVAARTTHLGTFFGTLALAALVAHARWPRRRALLLALAATAAALASYEQAVVIPAIGTVWLALLHRDGWRTGVRASAGLWLLLVGYVGVRHLVFGLQPSWYHRMQVNLRPKEVFEWLAYVLPPIGDGRTWYHLPRGIYALFYPVWWVSLLCLASYVTAFRLVAPYRRTVALLLTWKAFAFAPMALLPPYPHYFYFSEVGSCLLGGLILAAAGARLRWTRLDDCFRREKEANTD